VEDDSSFGFLPIIEAMLENDPTQFGERDRQGRFPLNVLVESRCPPQLYHSKKIIQLLVKMHPRAASISHREGRLPLYLALENGWPFKPIMVAAMHAISTRDVLTRMYPFHFVSAHMVVTEIYISPACMRDCCATKLDAEESRMCVVILLD
jgi:hypothetical protein